MSYIGKKAVLLPSNVIEAMVDEMSSEIGHDVYDLFSSASSNKTYTITGDDSEKDGTVYLEELMFWVHLSYLDIVGDYGFSAGDVVLIKDNVDTSITDFNRGEMYAEFMDSYTPGKQYKVTANHTSEFLAAIDTDRGYSLWMPKCWFRAATDAETRNWESFATFCRTGKFPC